MGYITYAELAKATDPAILAQLSSDTPAAPVVGDNANIQTAIEAASAIVRSYARLSDIYSDADLDALALAVDPLLTMIVADLATEELYRRKGISIPESITARGNRSAAYLVAIRDGKQMFGALSAVAEAGKPVVAAVPSATRGYYRGVSDSRFFPTRRPGVMP